MKTLSLPIRGHIERVSSLGGALFVQTRHQEGRPLGVYKVALASLIRGELRGEEALTTLQSAHGAPITWLSTTASAVWATDAQGGLWSAGAEELELTMVAELGAPVTHAALCGEALAWSDQEGGVHLWAEGAELWSWSASAQGEEGAEEAEVSVSAMRFGHGALVVGLSDGTMRLWSAIDGGLPSGEPIEISAHDQPVCALLTIEAEGRAYLLSCCEGLQVTQTRLDDLSPMSRASKGKGLHTLPVTSLISGPLGRFYSLSRDGSLKAWQDAYSNVRPASHDGLGELISGALFECPVQDMDGAWPLKSSLVLATSTALTVYELTSEPAEGEEAQVGRLGPIRYAVDGVERWLERSLNAQAQEERATLLKRVASWGDALALTTLSQIAATDQDPTLRLSAVQALLKSEHPQVIHTLEGLLSSEDDQVASAALQGLRSAHGLDSLYPMQRALTLGGEGVSIEACAAYAERAALRDEEALAELKAVVKGDRVAVAQAARVELERAMSPLDASLYTLNNAQVIEVQVASVQRLYRLGLTDAPRVQSRLQALREDETLALREAALSASLLGRPVLAQLLRSSDELLHEQLRTFEALDLKGEARSKALSLDRPERPELDAVSATDRQALFELSACASADIAIHGPVALAELGDLRALPILLALSRSGLEQVRLRATRGLSALAGRGERRALSPLKTLCSDPVSVVRLSAYTGLRGLLAEEVIHYVEVGLSAGHHDVRLAAISMAESLGLPSEDEGAWQVLRRALVHQGDLELAREARKVYLRDQVGGDALGTHLLLLESAHVEVRRASLHDMVSALKAGHDLESQEVSSSESGGAGQVKGKTFLFTGTLSRMKRADAQKKVVALGGLKASAVSGSLDFLVLGDEGKAGSKLDKARKLGVRVLSETEFMDMIGEGVGETAVGADAPLEASSKGTNEGANASPLNEGEPRDPYHWIRALGRALLDDPALDLRTEARRSLLGEEEGKGALVGPLRLELLGGAMRSTYQDNRLGAISALGGVEDTTRAVALLSERLGDPSSEVSTAALKAALKLSDEAAEQLLSAGMEHSDGDVRGAALSAVVSAPKKAPWRSTLLWRTLEDASPHLRAEAMDALKGDEAVEVAEQLLNAQHPDIRGRAALCLARSGDERALSFVMEALTTPKPTMEEVERAQASLDGGLGLLDERRWRREVTVALSAHQEAFAHAAALGAASTEGGGALGHAEASASVRQSVTSLVRVQDQIESAYSSAVSRWRASIQQALRVAIEGEYLGAWPVIWALNAHEDESVRRASWGAWSAVAPSEVSCELEAQLRDDERGPYAARALAKLGHVDGLLSMRGRGASLSEQLHAAHMIGDEAWRERIGAEVVTGRESTGELALDLEVLRLATEGGESSLLTAALSSDDTALRRRAAGLIERAHSAPELFARWCELMQERRPQEEREREAQHVAFKEGALKEKPKGKAPKWLSATEWERLAQLVWHHESSARRRGLALLERLPRDSDSASDFLNTLKAYTQRYGGTERVDRRPMTLSREDARALAFGTYAGLLSLTQDLQSLKELTRLIDVDPVGSLALLTVVLRGSASLREAAKQALHEHREALGLSELSLAELLISTEVTACVREGAAMVARLDEGRSIELIRSDSYDAAQVAFEVSLKRSPKRALSLSIAALNSGSSALRAEEVSRLMRVLKAAERLGWRAEAEVKLAEELSLSTLSEEQGRRFGLTLMDVTMIQGLSDAGCDGVRLGEAVYQHLLSVLTPASGERPAFADVQLLIAEGLAARHDEQAFAPLQRALSSDHPELTRRGLRGLVALRSPLCAPAIFARLTNDPAKSLDQGQALDALAKLRDPVVASGLLGLFGDARYDDDDLSRTVLEISGFDEKIDEEAVWEELSSEEREEETRRGYQSATLALHLTASVRVGRYSDVLYYDELLEAAKTARGPAPELDASLVSLFGLPRGDYEVDETRREAVAAYGWRAQHRGADPSPLCALLTHRDDDTRWRAALGLAFAKRSEGLDLLLQLVKDKVHGYSWRSQAVKALGVCADLRAVRALLRVYDDPEDYLREEALEALGHMGKSEVAEEIRARLIEGLSRPYLGSLAIQGIRFMGHPETWGALRSAVRYARIDRGLQEEALIALRDDESPETLELFEWLLKNARGATRDRSAELHLSAYEGWRARLGALPDLDASPAEVTPPQSLAPERALFSLDGSGDERWERGVKALERFGDAELWLALSFEANALGGTHQTIAGRFEAKLRALDPTPLELLFDALPRAASHAPQLADMTLTLIGGRASSLSSAEKVKLLSVTAEVREAWCAAQAEGLGAPIDPRSTLGERVAAQAKTWERLLWLWGKTTGGEAELWSALSTEDITASLAREALLSLSSCASRGELELGERLLSCPAAALPELSTLVTRLVGRTEALRDKALTQLNTGEGLSLNTPAARASLWRALSEPTGVALSDALSEALIGATLEGDPLALDALVQGAHASVALSIIRSLGEEARDEGLTCAVLSGVAQLGDEAVEEALVTLAKRSKRPLVTQAAWRARRRSSRARARQAEV